MTNIFRPVYRTLSESEKSLIDAIKDQAAELHQLILTAPEGRYRS